MILTRMAQAAAVPVAAAAAAGPRRSTAWHGPALGPEAGRAGDLRAEPSQLLVDSNNSVSPTTTRGY